jgi:4-hydroxy-3-methylbut-2-enyl diphosphate reductase
MSAPRVIVLGGGIAGIEAALRSREAGAAVTLLESRGRLGGAAFSFTRDEMRVDNGQHVFLRCCTAYREFLEEIGAADLVTLQPRLSIPVLAPGGRRAALRRSSLPAPLHMAATLMRYPYLTRSERISAARAMAVLRNIDFEDPAVDQMSFGDWLAAHGQSSAAIARLWDLIVRPTVNLAPEAASLAQVAQVFQVGVLSRRASADIGYARVPLSEIHDVAARQALERAGVDVRLRCAATAVRPFEGAYAVDTSRGRTLEAEAVVVAVPPERAARLLPGDAGVEAGRLAGLGRSPIVNLHVVYDRRVMDMPFAAGVGTPVQWVFDRTNGAGLLDGQYLAISLSAADDELGTGPEELRSHYLPALAEIFPAAADAQVESFFVTREHSATFRAEPGARALRPPARTALRGVVLAGSWTDTGWPATMEGAVRSGRTAAAAALESLGRPILHLAGSPQPGLRILTALVVEERAVRAGAPWARVERTGMGPRRASRAARSLRLDPGETGLIAGFCGALAEGLEPGDIVLANRIEGPAGSFGCADPSVLAGVLRRAGLRVHVGPIACSPRLVLGRRRGELAQTGALAADMESAWLAPVFRNGPPTVLRVVVDTGRRELLRPVATISGAATAYHALRRAAGALREWAQALGQREVMLASPRASCAGVDRAVEIVERALEAAGPPIYVRKQIVHNAHVIADLEGRGAVFVEELDEVPPGATVIFSAHGVSPAVRADAQERELEVIDATCPLVAKVHAEARRFAAAGMDVVLVGHAEHEEVEGTMGEAPERTHLIATADEVDRLAPRDPERIAYLTQTTLAVDETAEVVERLRKRFPRLRGPKASDICYATQNRQDAVRALAGDCDLVLVVGSTNSSNSKRLVEVAERAGCRALLIDDASEIEPALLVGTRRLGLTAGASAPEALVHGVVSAIRGLGGADVSERTVATEDVHFKLPVGLRREG